jgi:hypothetical protein
VAEGGVQGGGRRKAGAGDRCRALLLKQERHVAIQARVGWSRQREQQAKHEAGDWPPEERGRHDLSAYFVVAFRRVFLD